MTRDEWTQLSRQISVAWPSRPLGPDEDKLFYEVLRGLPQNQVADGILKLVHDGVTVPPGPGELYRASTELAPAAPPPTRRLVVDVSNTPPPRPAVAPAPMKSSTSSLMSGQGNVALPPVANTGAPSTATTAMVLGIVSVFVGICAPIAIIFGAIGIRDSNRLPGQPGKGQAIAGLVLGIIITALWVWLIIVIAGAASTYPTY